MAEEKCCCCKEPTGSIPINRIIEKVDSLAAVNDRDGIERVLSYWEGEARALNDTRGLLEILSEQIGFFRRDDDRERGLAAVDEALAILAREDIGDSVSYATVYLNCATTMKAFGKAKEAMPYYLKAKDIYERLLEKDDFRLSGLYNNFATALNDLGDFDGAYEYYVKAAELLKAKGGHCELAITYINMAQLFYDRARGRGETADNEVDAYLDLAYDALNDQSLERNGNYAGVCAKCAAAFGFYGDFIRKRELNERAEAIYRANAEK